MNPARGSEVRERAREDVEAFLEIMNDGGIQPPCACLPPRLSGDVRQAYVAAFCAQLLAAEGITAKRLAAAADDGGAA